MTVRRVIVANLWDRVEKLGRVPEGAPDPTPEELAAIGVRLLAQQPDGACGPRPVVRVVEETAFV